MNTSWCVPLNGQSTAQLGPRLTLASLRLGCSCLGWTHLKITSALRSTRPHRAGQGRAGSHLHVNVCLTRSLAEGEELRAWLSTIFSSFMTRSGGTQRAARANRDASQHKVSLLPLGTGRVGVNQVKFRCIQFFGEDFYPHYTSNRLIWSNLSF